MVLRTCFRSKPPRTSARGRASVSLLLGYQTQSHLSVGVSTRFDWKTAWSLAVVAAVTAVTPAAGQGTGFTGSVIVVTQPGNDTFATCPVGYVVSEACSSGFQPQCRLNGSGSTEWLGVVGCVYYPGLLNTSAGTAVAPATLHPTSTCPRGTVMVGLCTSAGTPGCPQAEPTLPPALTVVQCIPLSSGLPTPPLAPHSAWSADASVGTTTPSGITVGNRVQGSVAWCDAGTVAVGACSSGFSSNDCSTALAEIPLNFFTHLLCVAIPTTLPPTNLPTPSPTQGAHHCDVGTDGCDPVTTVCVRALPAEANAYVCVCKLGYLPVAGSTSQCQPAITTAPSLPPTTTLVSDNHGSVEGVLWTLLAITIVLCFGAGFLAVCKLAVHREDNEEEMLSQCTHNPGFTRHEPSASLPPVPSASRPPTHPAPRSISVVNLELSSPSEWGPDGRTAEADGRGSRGVRQTREAHVNPTYSEQGVPSRGVSKEPTYDSAIIIAPTQAPQNPATHQLNVSSL